VTGDYGLGQGFELSDEFWEEVAKVLPPPKAKKRAGRPRMADRQAMTAIVYILRTGMQWKALPRSLGAASTVHDRFQEWREAGVFMALWRAALEAYDETRGIDWSWQALDGAMTKAPLGGKRYGSESDRPGEAGDQAQPAGGRLRDTVGRYRGWRESA
jgi:putative transposase